MKPGIKIYDGSEAHMTSLRVIRFKLIIAFIIFQDTFFVAWPWAASRGMLEMCG